jgi:hypothetical protein
MITQKEYNENYYNQNKDRILNSLKTKTTCECGCVVSKSNLTNHKKTKKHQFICQIKNLTNESKGKGIVI